MRFSRPGFVVAALAMGVAVAACSTSDPDPTPAIFTGPAWDGAETMTYHLDQEGRDSEATCVLETDPGEGGETTLNRLCSDDAGNRDDGVAVVVNDTLEPLESTRTTFDAEDNRTTTHSVTYGPVEAEFETASGGDSRTTTRDLPAPTEDVPEPAWYDDESLLWLIRGIRLEEGYEDTYTHVINAGQPRVLNVDISVHGPEEVEVPAGTFESWRIRVSRESTVYTFWVSVEEPRLMVRARIEDSTYELVSIEQ